MDAMATTIQVSEELLAELKNRKMHTKESYEEIIWNLIEDTFEFSEGTKKDIEKSRQEIAHGKTISFEEIKRKMRHVHH